MSSGKSCWPAANNNLQRDDDFQPKIIVSFCNKAAFWRIIPSGLPQKPVPYHPLPANGQRYALLLKDFTGTVTEYNETEGLAEEREDGGFELTIRIPLEDWMGVFPFRRGDAVTVKLPDQCAGGVKLVMKTNGEPPS